jgi:hypothetical protein
MPLRNSFFSEQPETPDRPESDQNRHRRQFDPEVSAPNLRPAQDAAPQAERVLRDSSNKQDRSEPPPRQAHIRAPVQAIRPPAPGGQDCGNKRLKAARPEYSLRRGGYIGGVGGRPRVIHPSARSSEPSESKRTNWREDAAERARALLESGGPFEIESRPMLPAHFPNARPIRDSLPPLEANAAAGFDLCVTPG